MAKKTQTVQGQGYTDDDWLTVDEAASMLPCSKRHLWTLIREDARDGLDKQTRYIGRKPRVYVTREWLARISNELASGLRRSRAHGAPRSREIHQTIEVRCSICKTRLPVEAAGVEQDKRRERHYVLLYVDTSVALKPSTTDEGRLKKAPHQCYEEKPQKGDDD